MNQSNLTDIVANKLEEARATPGHQVEMEPTEAELAGAFHETAIGEREAQGSTIDLPH